MEDKCKPCYGISCPHWRACFPQFQNDIKELDEEIKKLKIENIGLVAENEILKGQLKKYGCQLFTKE